MQPGITHTGLFYTFSPGPSTQPPAHTTDVSAVGTDSQLPTVLTHQSERVDSEISSEQQAEPESCSSSDSEPDTHISDEEPSSTSCQGNFQHTQSLVPDDVSCTDDTPLHAAVSSGDFGQVALLKTERKLTDQEKFALLSNHFVPSRAYKFPSRDFGSRSHTFQHNWLNKFNGLVYSESQNGGYCMYCVLFAKEGGRINTLGALVNTPLIDFKRATEKLTSHFAKKFHIESVETAESFAAVMKKPELAIDRRLSSERSRRAARNTQKLISIAETVIFCGRQNIALRGHRDDTLATKQDATANHGNFLALLQFRVQAGDLILKEHLENAAGNALYTSKTVQNELITICGNIIRGKIVKMVQEAEFFSVIADEATDVANDEQLSISLRFVCNNEPCERFVAFHECMSGVTGSAIAQDILSKLSELQLQTQFLCGQAYDGAGAMAGKSKGASAVILSKYPKALYTHCASHRLNLCVVNSCSIQEVSNMMQTADKISRFFSNSPKRQLHLESWIDSTIPGEQRKKLKELCRTRWVQRHEAFEVFL